MHRRLGRALLLILLAGAGVGATPATERLGGVVVVTRHGVRTPLTPPGQLAPFAAEPWPEWEAPPGDLTPHGRMLMTQMGRYYRERYVQLGLLTGQPEEDSGRIFFRANNFPRTAETGRALAEGLTGNAQPDLHLAPAGTTDALFLPSRTRLGHPDAERALAAVRARFKGDPAALVRTQRAAFGELDRVLFGGDGGPLPEGKVRVSELPVTLAPGPADGDLLVAGGAFSQAMTLVENLALEYENGRPAAEVGWGRLDLRTLKGLFKLHALNFDLTQRTLYPAQVEGSNLASHVLESLAPPAPGAAPGPVLTFYVGHDTNIVNLGGILDASWTVDGLPSNPSLPGGALVFELWNRDGRNFVRTYYVAQTLDQMRQGTPPSLEHPPAIAAVYIPGASTGGRDYEAPWEAFVLRVRQRIAPEFVAP